MAETYDDVWFEMSRITEKIGAETRDAERVKLKGLCAIIDRKPEIANIVGKQPVGFRRDG